MSENRVEKRIREESARLLSEGTVEMVIGFETGTLPHVSTPGFITRAEDAGRLVWNPFCTANLAAFLCRFPCRVGIVAKACDTRAIAELLRENQIQRENLVIIGVPCRGMIDLDMVPGSLRQDRTLRVVELDGEPALQSAFSREVLIREELLQRECKACPERNPVVHDILIEGPVPDRPADLYPDVAEFSSRPADDRWAYIAEEMNRCVRCYACRNACPLCYCAECFADAAKPGWIGRGAGESDNLSFHLMRALHLAGRCVDCGACRRACPMQLDFRILGRKVSADVERWFGYRPGLDPERKAPLSSFHPDDTEEFMLDPSSRSGS